MKLIFNIIWILIISSIALFFIIKSDPAPIFIPDNCKRVQHGLICKVEFPKRTSILDYRFCYFKKDGSIAKIDCTFYDQL